MDHHKSLHEAIIRILNPLVRMLLRNGISYGTFADIAKEVFVKVAANDFDIAGRKQSVSRIAVLTGLNRKAVKEVLEKPCGDENPMDESYNRAARVIAGWRRDKIFLDDKGDPAPLPFSGDQCSFSALVKRYSGDMPARAVLDELVRVNAVNTMGDGSISLGVRAYIPAGDDRMKLHILGTDVAHLINTIGHNLNADKADTRMQRKVAYNNLPQEALPGFRKMAAEKAQALLEQLDRHLAAKDRDSNPRSKGMGRFHAGVGIYYFEEPYDDKE